VTRDPGLLEVTARTAIALPDGLEAAVRRALEAIDLSAGLSLVLVDDAEIRGLNARFLDHDWATDVLAFPYDDAPPDAPDRIVGEVVVSVETAAREAAVRGLPLSRELLLYVVHGCLHLQGMEDATDEGRAAMAAAAERVLGEVLGG